MLIFTALPVKQIYYLHLCSRFFSMDINYFERGINQCSESLLPNQHMILQLRMSMILKCINQIKCLWPGGVETSLAANSSSRAAHTCAIEIFKTILSSFTVYMLVSTDEVRISRPRLLVLQYENKWKRESSVRLHRFRTSLEYLCTDEYKKGRQIVMEVNQIKQKRREFVIHSGIHIQVAPIYPGIYN